MSAPEILIDDRAATLVPLIANGDHDSFRRGHRAIFDAQGFGRFERSVLRDRAGFEQTQQGLQTAPSSGELKDALQESSRRLAAVGYSFPSPIRVRIGVGGSFDGKNVGGTLMFSLDRINRGDELVLAAHELSHRLLDQTSLSLLPLPLDRRLASEAVAIAGSVQATECRHAKAAGLSEDVYDELAARFDQALAAFRASRINDYSGGEFPAKPFLGGSGRRFDRYGYFLAERLLAGLSPAEVCDLLLDETALAERVIEFLGTTDRDYAALLSPGIDPVEIIEAAPYEQLAEARHGSWNGRFRWLDSFAQIARTTPFDYSNVLDVGCGTGHNLRQLVAAGGSGLGIDPSAAMLANWVDHKRLQSRCCGLFDLDDNGAFTLIMSAFDTFNHILVERSLAETLERLHSLLAPGGHLVFDFVTEVGLASKVGIGRFDERDSGWQVLDVHSYDRSEALMDTLSFIRNLGTDTMYLERHRERATTLGKAMRALHSAGFTEVRPFASNGIDDPTPDEARIFMHARRPDQSAPRKARQNMILRTRVPSNFQADMA